MIEKIQFLKHKAYNMRVSTIKMTTKAGSGHPTSSLSAADIVAALFFDVMKYNPRNFHDPDNDHFILSKGHASPILYAAWKEVGVLTEKEMMTYREFDSVLEGHPTFRFAQTEAATGSLGIGLSIGAGMALSAKMDNRNYYTYVMLGDSEISEGSVWEAVQIAAYYKLDNLIAIVDCNRLGQSTATIEGHDTQKFVDMFTAFGWHTFVVDGHDMDHIIKTLNKARKIIEKPCVIIAKTLKGYGVEKAEDKMDFHGKTFKPENLDTILAAMRERFLQDAIYSGKHEWQPSMPEQPLAAKTYTCKAKEILLPESDYKETDQVPTRKAFGQALAQLGTVCDTIVSLDAEVKNSTYAEIFEKQHPDRFIQCFIAEQNMVSMGVGMDLRGKMPFISTFGAFMSRAHDQIRMAAIGQAKLRLVGSHAGISIGQDGPSQMALEDLAMMRALPESIVLYPCDAVSTYKLVGQMAHYDKGISYLRTTRAATPVLYDNNEDFPIGGCKVLRKSKHDRACIVAAGITVFEALRAYDLFAYQDEPIHVAVIDLYSIKPLDARTIIDVAKNAGRVVTVEDHYLQGGLGQAVAYELRNTDISIGCLAVEQLPRSGTPDELLAYAGIDAQSIVNKISEMF